MSPRRLAQGSRRLLFLAALALPVQAQVALAALTPESGQPAAHRTSLRALHIAGQGLHRVLAQGATEDARVPHCWVLPVPGAISELASVEAVPFDLLDRLTAPARVETPAPESGWAGCGRGGATEVHAQVGGGLSAWRVVGGELTVGVARSSSDVGGVLAAEGCEPVRGGLAGEGWQYVVAHLQPAVGVESPVEGALRWALRVDYVPSGPPTLSLDALLPGASEEVDLVVYLAAAHRQRAAGRLTVDPQPPSCSSGQPFEELYDELLRDRLAEAGPGALVTEFASPCSVDSTLAGLLADVSGGLPEPAIGYVTRLRTLLPPADLAGTVTFEDAPTDEPLRVRVISSARSLAPLSPAAPPGPPSSLVLVALAVLLALGWLRSPARRPARAVSVCAVAAIGAVLLASCLPIGTFRSAEILDEGQWEGMAAVAPARDARHYLDSEPPAPERATSPRAAAFALGARYGLGRSYDLGLVAFPLGAQLELRRQLFGQDRFPVAVTLGVTATGFVDPVSSSHCVQREGAGSQDGCFEERRWGGMAELPLTVSQHGEQMSWYAGLRVGAAWLGSDLRYSDPHGVFADIDLDKEAFRWTTSLFGGVELQVRDGLYVVPELQLLTTINDVDRVTYYFVPGLALRLEL